MKEVKNIVKRCNPCQRNSTAFENSAKEIQIHSEDEMRNVTGTG